VRTRIIHIGVNSGQLKALNDGGFVSSAIHPMFGCFPDSIAITLLSRSCHARNYKHRITNRGVQEDYFSVLRKGITYSGRSCQCRSDIIRSNPILVRWEFRGTCPILWNLVVRVSKFPIRPVACLSSSKSMMYLWCHLDWSAQLKAVLRHFITRFFPQWSEIHFLSLPSSW
jgi:hypothetical protein